MINPATAAAVGSDQHLEMSACGRKPHTWEYHPLIQPPNGQETLKKNNKVYTSKRRWLAPPRSNVCVARLLPQIKAMTRNSTQHRSNLSDRESSALVSKVYELLPKNLTSSTNKRKPAKHDNAMEQTAVASRLPGWPEGHPPRSCVVLRLKLSCSTDDNSSPIQVSQRSCLNRN